MLSEVCKERLEYFASLKGHVGQAVTMCRVELSDISTELLSLREQLAELKALPPVAVLYRTGEVLTRAECADDRTFAVCCKVETPLFTAAKPSVENDIAKFMGGVKNSMAKEVAKVIQKEALLIMFDEITPDTETIAMQYESLVKRINCPED